MAVKKIELEEVAALTKELFHAHYARTAFTSARESRYYLAATQSGNISKAFLGKPSTSYRKNISRFL